MKGWYGDRQRHKMASKGVRTRGDLSKMEKEDRQIWLERELEKAHRNPKDVDWEEIDRIYASMGIKKDSIEDYAMNILIRLDIGRFEDASEIYKDFIKVYGKDKTDDLNHVIDKLNDANKDLNVVELDKKIMMNYFEGKRKTKSKGIVDGRFEYHHDAGHGWLKVPKKVIIDMGLWDSISPYSYVGTNNVYLEEDVDASIFIDAYKKKYGQDVKFDEIYDGDESKIRDLVPIGVTRGRY